MIIGIDIGSYAVKTSEHVSFQARCSASGSILNEQYNFSLNECNYSLEHGDFDTEFRKVERPNILKYLYAALVLSDCDYKNKVVLGLPLSQYKDDKVILEKLIRDNPFLCGTFNGKKMDFQIEDVLVYPEAIGTVQPDFEGIIIDIGGRTTDVCVVRENRKVSKAKSLNHGILTLYSQFIDKINSVEKTDLTLMDAERIIRNGLYIKGEEVNISYAKQLFIDFLDSLISRLNTEYSLKTYDVMFTGGGSIFLKNIIHHKFGYEYFTPNSRFANALAFEKVGRSRWNE